MEEIVHIYALFDSRYPERIRYVGKTERTVERRLYDHIRDARLGHDSRRHRWIRSVINAGAYVLHRTLAIVSASEWQTEERKWIANLRAAGHDLTNISIGGDGLDSASWKAIWADEERNVRKKSRLTKANPENIARARKSHSDAMKKRFSSSDARKKISIKLIEANKLPEVRKNKSEKMKLRWTDPEKRRAIGKAISAALLLPHQVKRQKELMKSRLTTEYRQHLSNKMVDRWADENKRAKLIVSLKAARSTEESRNRSRIAATAMWKKRKESKLENENASV